MLGCNDRGDYFSVVGLAGGVDSTAGPCLAGLTIAPDPLESVMTYFSPATSAC